MDKIDAWVERIQENTLMFKPGFIEIYAHVLIDKEEDLYTAHCLEFDIVADGKTISEAKDEILKAIANHISFCLAMDNKENILNPAPKEYWNRFYFGSKIYEKPYEFPKDFTFENVKLPFIRDLIPQVKFNRAYEYA